MPVWLWGELIVKNIASIISCPSRILGWCWDQRDSRVLMHTLMITFCKLRYNGLWQRFLATYSHNLYFHAVEVFSRATLHLRNACALKISVAIHWLACQLQFCSCFFVTGNKGCQIFCFFTVVTSSVEPVSSEIPNFAPYAHAQSNILHIKHAEKTDDWDVGFCV